MISSRCLRMRVSQAVHSRENSRDHKSGSNSCPTSWKSSSVRWERRRYGSIHKREPLGKEKKATRDRHGTQVLQHGGKSDDQKNQVRHKGKENEEEYVGEHKEHFDGKNKKLDGKTTQDHADGGRCGDREDVWHECRDDLGDGVGGKPNRTRVSSQDGMVWAASSNGVVSFHRCWFRMQPPTCLNEWTLPRSREALRHPACHALLTEAFQERLRVVLAGVCGWF